MPWEGHVLRLLLAICLIMISASTSFAGYVYVDDSGPNDPGTGTAADPYRSIEAAIANSVNGDEIRVAQGSYVLANPLSFSDRVVRGGYPGFGRPGTWETQSLDNSLTSIVATSYYARCFLFDTASNVVIEQLTIGWGEVVSSINVQLRQIRISGGLIVRNTVAVHIQSVEATGASTDSNTDLVVSDSLFFSSLTYNDNLGGSLSNNQVHGYVEILGNEGLFVAGNDFVNAEARIEGNPASEFKNNNIEGGAFELGEVASIRNNRFVDTGSLLIYGLASMSTVAAPIFVSGNTFVNVQNLFFQLRDEDDGADQQKLIVEDNEILLLDFASGVGVNIWGGVLFRNNYLRSEDSSATAIRMYGGDGQSLPVVASNNISGWNAAFEDVPFGASILGNLGWGNSTFLTPSVGRPMYPFGHDLFEYSVNYSPRFPTANIYGNCSDVTIGSAPTQGYRVEPNGAVAVESIGGSRRYFRSLTDAEQSLGFVFPRPELPRENYSLDAPPVDPRATACGGVGIGGNPNVPTTVLLGWATPSLEWEWDNAGQALDVSAGRQIVLRYRLWQGGPVTDVAWTQLEGPPVSISSINAEGLATVTLPDAGVYRFQLEAEEYWPPVFPVKRVMVEVRASEPEFSVFAPNGTPSGSYANLQAAIDAAHPGDTVQLPEGRITPGLEYAEGVSIYGKESVIVQGTGSSAMGTTLVFSCGNNFQIDSSTNVTLRGLQVVNQGDCFQPLISIFNSQIILDDIVVDQATANPYWSMGIRALSSAIEIGNSQFRFVKTGVSLGGCSSGSIADNRFEALSSEGILVDNVGCVSANVSVRDNAFDLQQAGRAAVYVKTFQAPNGSLEILNNVVTDAPLSALLVEGPVTTATPVRIEGNTFGGDSRWGWANGSGISLKGTGEYDIAHNTIYGFANSAIYNAAGSIGVHGNVLSYSADGYGVENQALLCGGGGAGCVPKAWASQNLTYRNAKGNYLNVDVRNAGVDADPLFANPDAGNFTFASASPLNTMDVGARDRAPLPGPERVKTEPGTESVTVTFDAVAGAKKYTVYWGDVKGEYPQSKEIGLHTFDKITGLAARRYYFVVRAHDGFREGEPSVAVMETPLSGHVWSVVEVDGVNPARVPSRKDVEVVVFGSGFVEGAKVFAGSTRAEVVEIKPNKLKVRFPKALKAGVYPIVVVNPDLGRGALPKAITVFDPARAESATGCASGDASGTWVLLIPLLGLLLARARSQAIRTGRLS